MNRLLFSVCLIVFLSTVGCSQSKLAKLTRDGTPADPSVVQVAFEEDDTIQKQIVENTVATEVKKSEGSEVSNALGAIFRKKTEITRIRSIWSEAAVKRDGTPVVQGLLCKVYLYGPESEHPQKGSGVFYFFGFDAASKDVKPDRQWAFKPEELDSKWHEDPVGGGYRFFLPWGDPSPTDLKCRAAVRFDTPEGKSIISPFTLVTMPGVEESEINSEVTRTSRTVTKKTDPNVELGKIVVE